MRTRIFTIAIALIIFTGTAENCKSQSVTVPEPEFLNSAVYVENNKAIKLEKAIPYNIDKRTTASYITGYHASESLKQVKGPNSGLRLPEKDGYSFIIRVISNAYDPYEEIAILKLESSRTGRKYKDASTDMLGQHKSGNLDYIPFDGKKYGESSYLIQVSQPMEAGEYAIMLRRASDVLNCFGVGEVMAEVSEEKTTSQSTTSSVQRPEKGNSGKQVISGGNQALTTGNLTLDAGFGLGSVFYEGTPVFVQGDYMINDDISIGGEITHQSYSEDYGYSSYSYSIDWKVTTVMARVSYHLLGVLDIANPQIDLYGGIALGYASVKAETTYSSYEDKDPLVYSIYAGGRYMFNERLGVIGELGYGLAALKIGLTYKLK